MRNDLDLAGFGLVMAAMGGGGDRGNLFPASDADDLSRGARFIPGEVTMARRAGQKVTFVTDCGPCCWHWQMPDGSRIYHWDRTEYEAIGAANGRKKVDDDHGSHFEDGVGACPRCGNPNTNGGTVPAQS